MKPEAEGEDDVIGLLAYALYKQAIREEVLGGNFAPRNRRIPTDTMVQAYRGAARQLLTGVIDQAISDSTPTIQESAVREALMTAETGIKAHIDSATNWKAAVATNLLAWLISLAIAFLILIMARAPDMMAYAVNAASE